MSSAAANDAPPLAKYLASTDKKTRDSAVKHLAAFLSEASENALSKPEMDRLWKGIFYCFWMSDKPLVQQALASDLAELALTITNTTASLAFLRGFWTTIVREWNGIDRLRIDKYYMLVRRFVNASFRLLIRIRWEEEACTTYNESLTSTGGPLCPTDLRVPTGLTYYVSEIYLEELEKALAATSDQPSPPTPLNILLSPFLILLAQTSASGTYKRVHSSLLQPLLEALTSSIHPEDDPSVNLMQRAPEAYPNIISNASAGNAQASRPAILKKQLLKMVFEVASRPETKDASRRKMYAIWREGADEVEDEEELRVVWPYRRE